MDIYQLQNKAKQVLASVSALVTRFEAENHKSATPTRHSTRITRQSERSAAKKLLDELREITSQLAEYCAREYGEVTPFQEEKPDHSKQVTILPEQKPDHPQQVKSSSTKKTKALPEPGLNVDSKTTSSSRRIVAALQHDAENPPGTKNIVLKDTESRDTSFLNVHCDYWSLGISMVPTIAQTIKALGEDKVSRYGWLRYTVSSLPAIPYDEISEYLQKPHYNSTLSFSFLSHSSGIIQYVYQRPKTTKNRTFSLPDLSAIQSNLSNTNPLAEFERLVDKTPIRVLDYYVGEPPLACATWLSNILHSGPKTSNRKRIPGINTSYLYASACQDSIATIHIEDANIGSANILIAGAPKDWLFIPSSCQVDFEESILAEFPDAKLCSQFVRHLNFLISPEWLRKRNIQYYVVRQSAGQMICTMPGVYHQVRNDGPNVAIAINFELDHWPNEPLDYLWCRKQSCGDHVITQQDFSIRETVISDDNANDKDSTAMMTWLPLELEDPLADLESLINHGVNNLQPESLGCSNKTGLRARLSRFLPSKWLDDEVLRVLLRIACYHSGYTVVDSLLLDVTNPSIARSDKPGGLVFPFHVNSSNQNSTTNRNHWIVAVYDAKKPTFTTYGMEDSLACRWTAAFQSIPANSDRVVELRQNQLPNNPDHASCALTCCLAIERYMGLHPINHQPPHLRNFYLRKLLSGLVISGQHLELVGARITYDEQPLAIPEDIPASGTSEVDLTALTTEAMVFKRSDNLLKEALMDDDSGLPLVERARGLQLIMQCTDKEMQGQQYSGQALVQQENTLLGVFQAIEKSGVNFFRAALHQRCLFVRLFKLFHHEVAKTKVQMKRNRLDRKQQRKQGLMLPPAPCSGQGAERRVLDQLVDSIGEPVKASSRKRVRTYVQYGEMLDYLYRQLGIMFLTCIPPTTVSPCNVSLSFSASSLSKPIESSEYYTWSKDQADFFIKWFPSLRPDLQSLAAMDYRQIPEFTLINFEPCSETQGSQKRTTNTLTHNPKLKIAKL